MPERERAAAPDKTCSPRNGKTVARRVYRQALSESSGRVLRTVPGPAAEGFEKTLRKGKVTA